MVVRKRTEGGAGSESTYLQMVRIVQRHCCNCAAGMQRSLNSLLGQIFRNRWAAHGHLVPLRTAQMGLVPPATLKVNFMAVGT